MAERLTGRIQQEVQVYAGPGAGRRHDLIHAAVAAAILDFVELAKGSGHHHLAVDRRYRSMGAGLVAEGHDLGPLLVAFQVAGGDLWREIGTLTRYLGLSGDTVAAVGEQVSRYLRHLSGQVEVGFRTARHAVSHPRAGLVQALLSTSLSSAELSALAEAAGWVLPPSVIVVVAEIDLPAVAVATLARSGVLVGREGSCTVLIGGPEARDDAVRLLLGLHRGAPLAVSWPVGIGEVRDAHRWACRALRLRRDGTIGVDERVIDCAAFRLQLWLAADPSLVSTLADQVLEPLRGARPTQQPVLAATLQRWLTTREPAGQLAAHLHVHEQTVRNHVRRLRELFGDRLDDPDQVRLLVLALGSMDLP